MSDSNFICPVCGNKDLKYTGIRNGKRYCRKCISFNSSTIDESSSFPKQASIFINYDLSKEQKELSDKLLLNYKQGVNSLVNAVCGSGKTEIVLQVISYVIKSGEKVAFAVPRRDVAIELCDRFKSIFKYNKVVCVYGGHHDQVEADLLVFTTPNYCMMPSAPMKTFLDLFFTNWLSHKPKEEMFLKQAIVLSTTAGAGAGKAAKLLANNLIHWGIPSVKTYGIAVNAMNWKWSLTKRRKSWKRI